MGSPEGWAGGLRLFADAARAAAYDGEPLGVITGLIAHTFADSHRAQAAGGELAQDHVCMAEFRDARWYAVRPASNTKPATYRCPLCGGLLPALSDHLLVLPEGDPGRRRHAHKGCVLGARRAGRLPLREEVEPRPPGLLARLRRRRGSGSPG